MQAQYKIKRAFDQAGARISHIVKVIAFQQHGHYSRDIISAAAKYLRERSDDIGFDGCRRSYNKRKNYKSSGR